MSNIDSSKAQPIRRYKMYTEGNGGSNVKGEDPRELLKEVINNFKISPESLSKISGIDKDAILDFANGINDDLWNTLTSAHMDFIGLVMSLSMPSASIDENKRVRAVIQTLNYLFDISFETIALYANLNTEDVESFIHDHESISIDKKYKLAVASMFLHYICKGSEN